MRIRTAHLVLGFLVMLGCGQGDPTPTTPADVGQVLDASTGDSGNPPDSTALEMGTSDLGEVDAGPSPPEPESFVLENVQNDFVYRLSHVSVTERGIFGIGPYDGPVVVELNPESPAFVETWVEVATFLTTGMVNGDLAVVTTSPQLSGFHQGEGVWAWVIDSTEMNVLGTAPLPDCVSPERTVVMNDSLAVIPCAREAVYVLDFSNPTEPLTVMRHEDSALRQIISVDGTADEFTFRYIGRDEIRSVSKSSFGNVSESQVSQFEQGWFWSHIAISEDRIWTHSGGGLVKTLESVSLTEQGEISTTRTMLTDVPELTGLEDFENGIGYHDQKLFLAGNYPDGKRIIVFDVQDPANPILIGTQYPLDDIARVNGFAFHDGQAYIYGFVNRGGGPEPILVVPVADLLD